MHYLAIRSKKEGRKKQKIGTTTEKETGEGKKMDYRIYYTDLPLWFRSKSV